MMRISWDAYHMELGLALFLLAESIIRTPASVRSTLSSVSLLSLAVLSNQLVGFIVIGTQLTMLLRPSIRRNLGLVPLQFVPVALYLLILYATMQTPLGPGLSIVGSATNLSDRKSVV